VKRTDIRAGVIYAVKSSYGAPSPIVFLEDGAAGLWTRERYHAEHIRPATYPGAKARAPKSFDPPIGYAAVIKSWGDATPADVLEALSTLDPATELERFRTGARPHSEALGFTILTTLGQIAGPYDEALAEYEAARKSQREREEEATALQQARRKRVKDARATLAAATGISSGYVQDSYGHDGIFITIEDTERLLALLAEKAEG
jgi:hypothetical protein